MANSREIEVVRRRPRATPSPVKQLRDASHQELLELIKAKLAVTSNRSQIAAELGMSRRNLYRYLEELGVTNVEPVLVDDGKGGFKAEVRSKK